MADKKERKKRIEWTDELLIDTVFEAMEKLELKRMPTESELRDAGYTTLVYGLKRVYGGIKVFREHTGIQSKTEYDEMVKKWKEDINYRVRSLMKEFKYARLPKDDLFLTDYVRSRINSVYGSYEEYYKKNQNIQRVDVRYKKKK